MIYCHTFVKEWIQFRRSLFQNPLIDMVFGIFLAFGRSSVGYILRPSTFGTFVYVSTLTLINLNILSWLTNKNIDQQMA